MRYDERSHSDHMVKRSLQVVLGEDTILMEQEDQIMPDWRCSFTGKTVKHPSTITTAHDAMAWATDLVNLMHIAVMRGRVLRESTIKVLGDDLHAATRHLPFPCQLCHTQHTHAAGCDTGSSVNAEQLAEELLMEYFPGTPKEIKIKEIRRALDKLRRR